MKNPQSRSPSSSSLLTPLDYAYRQLARRAYSKHELTEKMRALGFTEAAVAQTIERLLVQGYLNDAQLAGDYVERLRNRGFGCERIRIKLLQKGVPAETVEEVLFAEGPILEVEQARRFLASRFSLDALKQPKIAARAFRLLLNRGYSQDVVEQIFGSGLDSGWRTEEE